METTKKTNLVATVELTALTPIHIGTGQKMAPNAGFVHFPDEHKVAVLDEEKVLAVVGSSQIQTWVGLIHKNESLYKWLTGGRPNLRAADVARRTLHVPGPLGNTQEFRPMMHTGPAAEWPYIPGSSVKGAVRTALFAAAVLKNGPREFPQNERISGKWSAESMTKDVFGADPNHDYLRLLHIGDTHFAAGSTWCLKAEVLNQTDAGFQRKIPHLLEVLPVGATATATWHLAATLAGRAKSAGTLNPPAALADFSALLQAINSHTLRLVENELKRLPAREEDSYCAALLDVQAACKQCKKSNGREAIARVGFGSGHSAMTGDWLDRLSESQRAAVARAARRRDGYERFPFPKSRKLVPGAEGGAVAVPLGFLKLTLLTDEEKTRRAAQRQTDETAAAAHKAIEEAQADAEKAKANTAQHLPNRVKNGNEFEAVVIAFAGIQLTLKVLIGAVAMPPQAQHEQTVTLRYPSGLPVGAVVRVSIGEEQKGKIRSVTFKSIKFDPSKNS